MKKILIGLVLMVGLAAVATPFLSAEAALMKSGKSYGLTEEKQIEGDLYFAGERFESAGMILGDLFLLASNAVVGGTVEDELFIVAGDASLTGTTTGDVRVVAGILEVTGHISEDLFVVGGEVQVREGAVIEGDILGFAEHVVIHGTVHGGIEAQVGSLSIAGAVDGVVTVTASKSVVLEDTAHLKDSFTYSAPREALIGSGAVIEGEKRYTNKKTKGEFDWITGFSVYILILLVAGGLLVWRCSDLLERITSKVLSGRFGMVAFGLLSIILVPIIAIIALVSVIGVLPGLALLGGYITIGVLAYGTMPVVFGIILLNVFKKKASVSLSVTVFGAVALAVVCAIPLLGFIIGMVLFLLTFSAYLSELYAWIFKK